MRHTVIGLFDTYSQAESARDTLVQTGFARDTIELQANPDAVRDCGDRRGREMRACWPISSASSPACSPRSRAPPEARPLHRSRAARRRAGVRERGKRIARGARAQHPDEAGRDRHRRASARLGRGPARSGHRAASIRCSTNSACGAIRRPRGCPMRARPAADPLRTPPRRHRTARSRSIEDPLDAAAPLSEAADPEHHRRRQRAGLRRRRSCPSKTAPAARRPDARWAKRFRTSFSNMRRISATTTTNCTRAATRAMKITCPPIDTAPTIGRDARYRDRPWDDVEPEARRHWETTSPGRRGHVGTLQGGGASRLGSRDGTPSRLGRRSHVEVSNGRLDTGGATPPVRVVRQIEA